MTHERRIDQTVRGFARDERWFPVAEINGVGTLYEIQTDGQTFRVNVSSGPVHNRFAEGLTWAQAMDRVRDTVGSEIEDNASPLHSSMRSECAICDGPFTDDDPADPETLGYATRWHARCNEEA